MSARVASLYHSTIGKKAVMAITGIIMFGYLVGHMAGNLQIFIGRQKINDYAHFLHATPLLLWGTRAVLIVAIILHIWSAYELAQDAWKARPVAYAKTKYIETTYAARTMRWSGPIIFVYLVYHIMHLTLGRAPGMPYDPEDVYGNLVRGFQIAPVAIMYMLAMVLVGFHLYHGLWSFFQSLGLNHPKYNKLRRQFAAVMTVLICGGFIAVPISVLAGWVS